MFRKKTAAAALTAAVALSLSACTGTSTGGVTSSGGSSSSGGSAPSGGTLTIGALAFPTSFAADQTRDANWIAFYQAVYDPLLNRQADGTIIPWLATEWSYNTDNTVLTMKLRDDVTFTDGTKFTADVAAQNLLRFRDSTDPDAAQLAGIADAKAVDDTTLEIDLSAPDPALLNYLSKNDGMVGSPAKFGAADEATNPVGSGPYILDTAATVTESSYKFTKNPNYWNPSVQYWDTLVINVYADATAATNAIRTNEADGVKYFSNDAISDIKASGWKVVTNELDYQGLLLLDRAGSMNPALGDVRVRQAINYAFDREGMLQAVNNGFGTVTEQVFPKSSPAYDPALDTYYSYDPAKAKSLLAEAGYPNGFELAMPSTTLLGQAAFDLIAQQLGDVGITVKYTDVGNDFINAILAPKYPATWMQLQEDPNEWQLAKFSISPDGVFNPFHSTDATVAGYLTTIQNGTDAERNAAAKALNAYIVEQAWFAPWYRNEGGFAFNPAKVTVEMSQTNAYPMLFDIKPAS